jgi:hypothetical protein
MRLGRAALAVAASVVMACTLAASADAAARSSTPATTGNDVSYPQCSETLPAGQGFGIVAVNNGLANAFNPCLATEIAWAQTSSGTAKLPRTSLYVNTANPGNKVADWPANNTDPVTGNHVADPYGTCSGRDNQACAWQYGWNMADADARASGVSSPGSYRWWLDVETINSWESSAQNNRADLEGMVALFRHVGGSAGIYSTIKQWGPITGTVGSRSALYRLPDWIPGAKTLAKAKKNCGLTPLTGGGKVTVTQWRTSAVNTSAVNNDFSCRTLPAKKATR